MSEFYLTAIIVVLIALVVLFAIEGHG